MAQSLTDMYLIGDPILDEGALIVGSASVETLVRPIVEVSLGKVREVAYATVDHIVRQSLVSVHYRGYGAEVMVVDDYVLRRESLQRGDEVCIFVCHVFMSLTKREGDASRRDRYDLSGAR